ncbi:MAG: hypothetical protein NTW22_01185 [Proteobacteria bacterium]|nr:hypothetical protein [Pseudomonadota bacterium]
MKKYVLALFMSATILTAAPPVDYNGTNSPDEHTRKCALAVEIYRSKASDLDSKISELCRDVTSFCEAKSAFRGDLYQKVNALDACFPELAAEAKVFFSSKSNYDYNDSLENLKKTDKAFRVYSELLSGITDSIRSYSSSLLEDWILASKHNIEITIQQRHDLNIFDDIDKKASDLLVRFYQLSAEITRLHTQIRYLEINA